MCDYSLSHCHTRDAVVGDRLEAGKIQQHSGLTRGYPSSTGGFHPEGDDGVAVCLRPGTEIAFDAPVRFFEYNPEFGPWWRSCVTHHQVARFREINSNKQHAHHDALEFPDGKQVLLHLLAPGQKARVLQLPSTPKAFSAEPTAQRVNEIA